MATNHITAQPPILLLDMSRYGVGYPRATGGQIPSPKCWGASRGGRGTLWDLTPGDAQGSAFVATRLDRLHGRIPQAGPCSTFRRSSSAPRRALRHCVTATVIALAVLLLGSCSTARKAPESDRGSRPGSSQTAPKNGKTDAEIAATAAQNALAMRGKPYRYGGYSPQGFDCSGLVHYSYARAGGQLPRNTNGLWSRSRTISMSDLRPGDQIGRAHV